MLINIANMYHGVLHQIAEIFSFSKRINQDFHVPYAIKYTV